MKRQFDKDIMDALSSNLDSIHASDELIAKTLMRLREEGHVSDNTSETVLTAIDSRYVANHIDKKSKSRIIKLVSIAAAATMLLAGGILLKIFSTEQDTIAEPVPDIPTYRCYSEGPDYYYLSKTAAENNYFAVPEDANIPIAPQTGATRCYSRAAAARAAR